jgi:hypothetical protein
LYNKKVKILKSKILGFLGKFQKKVSSNQGHIVNVDDFSLDLDLPKGGFIPKSNQYVKPISKFFNLALFYGFMAVFLVVNTFVGYVFAGLSLKDEVEIKSQAGKRLVSQSLEQDDFIQTMSYLEDLSVSLAGVSNDINGYQGVTLNLMAGLPFVGVLEDVETITKLLAEISKDSVNAVDSLKPFLSNDLDPFSKDNDIKTVDAVDKLQVAVKELNKTLGEFEGSVKGMSTFLLPAKVAWQIQTVKNVLPETRVMLQDLDNNLELCKFMLGYEQSRTYLFLFQNNHEARATGGFIGSYALMKVDQGVVTNMDVREIYSPDGQLKEKILAPEPMRVLDAKWNLRDSNWFADFEQSSAKIMSFYEKTGGPTVDGILAMTPNVIERILGVMGTIQMDEYGVEVDAKNFLEVTQYKTGIDYDKAQNKPKQFLADMAPKFFNQMLSAEPEKFKEIVDIIGQSLAEKHLMLYFLDKEEQAKAVEWNIAGKQFDVSGDYLSVVNTNIGGKKSDGVIEETISQNVEIQANGDVINTVKIKKIHRGGKTKYDWWNWPNINYMRVYVPEGSELLSATGYDAKGYWGECEECELRMKNTAEYVRDQDLVAIENTKKDFSDWRVNTTVENNKTVIGGWAITFEGSEKEIVVQYKLPFRVRPSNGDLYTLLVQKQSGSAGSRYELNISGAKSLNSVAEKTSLENVENSEGKISKKGILRTDQYYMAEIKN